MMYNKMKDVNSSVAKKSLQRERKVAKMMAMLTGLFFLVYVPTMILRKVIFQSIDAKEIFIAALILVIFN